MNTNKRGYKKNSRHTTDDRGTEKKSTGNTMKETRLSGMYICSRCGKPIKDVSAALADKTDGQPVHFDCVLDFLKESETLHENESLTYIGQGRFAVIHYESMVTMKEFSIIRIIEWEDKNHRAEWRSSIADHFSLID